MSIPREKAMSCFAVLGDNKNHFQETFKLQQSVSPQRNINALLETELYLTPDRAQNPILASDTVGNGHAKGRENDNIEEGGQLLRSPPGRVDAIFQERCNVALQEVLLTLSSDTDDDFCQCEQETAHYVKQALPMKVDNGTSTDSDFLSIDSKSTSPSSGTPSSSDYVVSDEETESEEEHESKRKRVVHRQAKQSKGESGARRRRPRSTSKLVGTEIMRTSTEHEDLPKETRSRNEKGKAAISRQRRESSKLRVTKQGNEEKKGEGSRSGGLQRKKAATKVSTKERGKKGRKQLSPAVVDAIFGNIGSCVADVDELRKKRDEDALKCGRVIRAVGTESNLNCVRPELESNFEGRALEKNSTRDPAHESTKYNDSSRHNQAFTDCQPSPCQTDEEGTLAASVQQDCSVLREKPVGALVPRDRSVVREMLSGDPDSNFQRQKPTKKASYNTADVEARNPPVQLIPVTSGSRRSSSPVINYENLDSTRSEIGRQVRPRKGTVGHSPWSYESRSVNPRGHRSSTNDADLPETRRRSRSKSPAFEHRRRQLSRDSQGFSVEKSMNPLLGRNCPGDPQSTWEEVPERGRRQSRDVLLSDSRRHSRRAVSPYQPGQPSFRRSESRSTSCVRVAPDIDLAEDSDMKLQKMEKEAILSPSVDRRRRRHNEIVRESQKFQRQAEGKKPFYLTVDAEGRPHGLGKPAWMAEINKLATWLDLSCTDIRKQTHGDICIFKDRLNEHFEYSRDVSETYLRGLMGKAVTRKRTDLIGLIKRGGDRPTQMHPDVWDRLVRLSESEQRERRADHGRYANSCRRTLGRTGASGEDGIRERLREELGRSPDPDEVGEEMKRDKGFGKLTARTSIIRHEGHQGRPHDVFEENDQAFQARALRLQRFSSDEEESGRNDSELGLRNQALKRKEPLLENEAEGTEWTPRGSDVMCRTEGRYKADKNSKDDYIAQLEAEVRSLKGLAGDKSVSMRMWSSRSGVSPEDGED